MDWKVAIERQHGALVGILAALIALAAAGAETLPRRLHRHILRLLRPMEAATRRLVIIVSHTLPEPEPWKRRPPRPPVRSSFVRNGVGTGIVLPRGYIAPGKLRPALQKLSLPLLDPLRHSLGKPRRARSVPRISVLDFTDSSPVRPRSFLSATDPLDATRIRLRLKAIGAALDDLPLAARRFARWRARTAAHNRESENRRRSWPLKRGRPPGWRRKPDHAVYEVLRDTQWLARMALEPRDTS